MITYRNILSEELNRELFRNFIRRQVVGDCLRREGDRWVVKPDPFLDDWSEEDYGILVECLKNTLGTGGFVYGAFCDGCLKGFVSVEAEFFGSKKQYLDLTSIHVSEDFRRAGIGRRLFAAAREWAGRQGAEKLYISAHSAVESQNFYKSMGCVEAREYNQAHVEAEPYDCQLECVIGG